MALFMSESSVSGWRWTQAYSMACLRALADGYSPHSRLKLYADAEIDAYLVISQLKSKFGTQIAVFLRKTRLKRAVSPQADGYSPISRQKSFAGPRIDANLAISLLKLPPELQLRKSRH